MWSPKLLLVTSSCTWVALVGVPMVVGGLEWGSVAFAHQGTARFWYLHVFMIDIWGKAAYASGSYHAHLKMTQAAARSTVHEMSCQVSCSGRWARGFGCPLTVNFVSNIIPWYMVSQSQNKQHLAKASPTWPSTTSILILIIKFNSFMRYLILVWYLDWPRYRLSNTTPISLTFFISGTKNLTAPPIPHCLRPSTLQLCSCSSQFRIKATEARCGDGN